MAGKPIECTAAVCWAENTDLVLEKVVVAPPQEKEVRIQILYTGICFSDVHLQSGKMEGTQFPIIPGHEAVGVVESVGPGVTSVKAGDNVIPIWCIECGECSTCKRTIGKRNACQRVLTHGIPGCLFDGTKRITCKGQEVGTFSFVGSFSEYTVVPEVGLAKINPGIELANLPPFGCCVPTGYGAVKYTAQVKEGSTVVIWGLGAVGLCTAAGAKKAKAARVIGVDLNSDKFPMAEKFGCTRCINPKDYPGRTTKQVIDDLTNLGGADYAFICVGAKAAADEAMESCSLNGGECIIVGLMDAPVTVNPLELVFGKTLKGSWGGDCHFQKDVPDLVNAYLKGEYPCTDDLITHRLPLAKVNEGIDLLKKGKSIRTILKL